ncbi:MAG TPA: helix-turn-helix transcriptional regulator [Pseudonocardiaceae bacterium]
MSDTTGVGGTPGVAARRDLAELLKQVRLAHVVNGRRMTQAQLAACLGCSQGKVQKIEAGAVAIETDYVEQIIKHLNVPPDTADRMRDLVAFNAVGEPWAKDRALVPHHFRQYMQSEQIATEIFSWHGTRIPGPLQSEQFMLRHFNAAGRIDVIPYLRNRARRKKLFTQARLRRYHCILTEETLHRTAFGLGTDVAQDQIDYLLAINDPTDSRIADTRTLVSLLPLHAPISYLTNDFSILHFDTGKPLVYIEYVGGGKCLKTSQVVTSASNAWHDLTHVALERDETTKLLQELRKKFSAR